MGPPYCAKILPKFRRNKLSNASNSWSRRMERPFRLAVVVSFPLSRDVLSVLFNSYLSVVLLRFKFRHISRIACQLYIENEAAISTTDDGYSRNLRRYVHPFCRN